jgi:hypothetical protein
VEDPSRKNAVSLPSRTLYKAGIIYFTAICTKYTKCKFEILIRDFSAVFNILAT